MITEREIEILKGIVGEAWVSADPCMMDTYSLYMNPEVLNQDGSQWLPRPSAVVLPASTAEVQEIVRLCNRTDLMVKPISTGFGTWAAASRDRVIVLDLKRMDRIVDIDVRNQIAVVEPYVRAIDLQTELFRHGLNVHVVSCGGNHSVLASVAAAWGYGLTGSSMGYSGRNLLGVEWVMPDGDLLTLGSAGDGAGWFTCDGPGPAMRGVIRGFQGTMGALGVFTKCATKLYRWDGPSEFPVEGANPVYTLKELPPRIAMNVLMFPSARAMKDAGYKLGEAEIDYSQFRTPMFFSALGMSNDNAELKEILDSGVFQKIARYPLVNAVVGRSDGEFRWKMKALAEILAETGGVSMPLNMKPRGRQLARWKRLVERIDDPLALVRRMPRLLELAKKLPLNTKQGVETYSRLFMLLIRHACNTQACFRPSQGMFTTLGSFDTWDLGVEQSEWIGRQKKAYIQRGLILDDDGELGCGGTFESGHMGYLEGIGLYSPKRPESVMAARELVETGVRGAIDNAFGVPIAAFGCEANERFGPACSDYHLWMNKIKKALDPHNASDPFFYADPDRGPES